MVPKEITGLNTLSKIRKAVSANAARVKALGNWPEYIDEVASLVERIPTSRTKFAPGFDAGIACALNLIPENKQALSATLHANYTIDAVNQVRRESAKLKVDSETCWWLAACSVCDEGCTGRDVLNQIGWFNQLCVRSDLRKSHALDTLQEMNESFKVIDDVPFAVKDGGMQGAYINGHKFAVGAGDGVWFVGTYLDSLGIPSKFKWGPDSKLSGPIHGSKQFVKCANLTELNKVISYAKQAMPG